MSQNVINYWFSRRKPFALSKRKIILIACDKAIADIEVQGAVLAIRIAAPSESIIVLRAKIGTAGVP